MRKIDIFTRQSQTIALYSWMLSLGLSLMYWILSAPGYFSGLRFVLGASLSSCVMLLPSILGRRFSRVAKFGDILFWDQCISLVFLLFLAAWGLFFKASLSVGSIIVFIFSLILFIYSAYRYLKRAHIISSCIFLVLLLAQIIMVAHTHYYVYGGYPGSTFIFLHGEWGIMPDRMFYGAQSAMINTYHMATPGVNGLTPSKSYWGAFALTAGYSNWLHLNAIDSLNWCLGTLFIPFFVKQFLLVGIRVSDLIHVDCQVKCYAPPIILLLIFITAIFSAHSLSMGLWSSIISQVTSGLSIGVMLILVGTVFYLLSIHSQQESNWLYLMTVILTVPLLMLLIGWTKTSYLLASGLLYGFVWLRFSLYRKWFYNLSMLLCVLVAWFTHIYFQSETYQLGIMKIKVFWFYKAYISNFFSFLIFYFLFTWVYLLLRFLELPKWFSHDWWLQKKFLDVELFFVIAVVSIIPASLLVVGGSGIYFLGILELASMFFAFMVIYRVVCSLFRNKCKFIGS